jgi:spore coat polysaccharide biosynthesis protein SpsF
MPLNIGAVLQARLGSTRLTEKALRALGNKPLIEQVYDQVTGSRLINKVILMTSTDLLDQKLIHFFESKNLGYSTGPVDDIIGRLFLASSKYSFDYTVRIWGDCPFVCPDIIDGMIQTLLDNNLEFISNSDILKRTFPPGLDVEIYSKALLEKMNETVTDPKKREFPIEFVRSAISPDKQSRYHDSSQIKQNNDLHLTVDYEEDLTATNEIYEILKKK